MPSSACSAAPRTLPSFPTRRSSDLLTPAGVVFRDTAEEVMRQLMEVRDDLRDRLQPGSDAITIASLHALSVTCFPRWLQACQQQIGDRKSTRLNSSHLGISYAVFCLFRRPPYFTLFPYTTLFRSVDAGRRGVPRHRRGGDAPADGGARRPARSPAARQRRDHDRLPARALGDLLSALAAGLPAADRRSEEHTSEL